MRFIASHVLQLSVIIAAIYHPRISKGVITVLDNDRAFIKLRCITSNFFDKCQIKNFNCEDERFLIEFNCSRHALLFLFYWRRNWIFGELFCFGDQFKENDDRSVFQNRSSLTGNDRWWHFYSMKSLFHFSAKQMNEKFLLKQIFHGSLIRFV